MRAIASRSSFCASAQCTSISASLIVMLVPGLWPTATVICVRRSSSAFVKNVARAIQPARAGVSSASDIVDLLVRDAHRTAQVAQALLDDDDIGFHDGPIVAGGRVARLGVERDAVSGELAGDAEHGRAGVSATHRLASSASTTGGAASASHCAAKLNRSGSSAIARFHACGIVQP